MITEAGRLSEQRVQRLASVRRSARRSLRVVGGIEERARELITMAAHDLRSPLASTKLRSHHIVERWRAGEQPACDEWASAVIDMNAAVDDAFRMIDDLLVVERLQDGGRRARSTSVIDIQTVVDRAIDREKLVLGQSRCRVVVRRNGLAPVRGRWDRVYLLRIFGNLLRNAANHAAGAPISSTLARRHDCLRIVFADRGPGLRGDGRDGTAGDPANRVGANPEIHGLGLWIVRRAVQRLDGWLRVHSRPGAGLAVEIEIPGLER